METGTATPLFVLMVLCCGAIIAEDKHDLNPLERMLMAASRSHSTGNRPSRELLLQALRTVLSEVEALREIGNVPQVRTFGDSAGFRATDPPPGAPGGPTVLPFSTPEVTPSTDESHNVQETMGQSQNAGDISCLTFTFPQPTMGRRRRRSNAPDDPNPEGSLTFTFP